jgi:hypothetical protein
MSVLDSLSLFLKSLDEKFLSSFNVPFCHLSDLLGQETINALVLSVTLVIVLNSPSRVGITSDLGRLTAPFQHLDQVLGIGRGICRHIRGVLAAKGASNGEVALEGAGVALLA